MAQPHIFVVEDEESLAETIALNLRLENYKVTIAKSGKQALDVFKKEHPTINLVLLDVMLPEINGFELCKAFKVLNPALPIIFLTAKNQIADKIEGLKLGADDYITKPFDLEELLLRVSNLIKRTQKDTPAVFNFNTCSINFETFEIKDISGSYSTLSKREIGLLKLLTENANKVISRDEIIEKLWDVNENASSRTIDNYILNFRKYFEANPKEPAHFHSIRGVGYKFIA
ncbi:MAG: response regulator transcription factor [Bacteroidia bacterium]|nr:response regulator transcription factor [Bacteroidia bacterium]